MEAKTFLMINAFLLGANMSSISYMSNIFKKKKKKVQFLLHLASFFKKKNRKKIERKKKKGRFGIVSCFENVLPS